MQRTRLNDILLTGWDILLSQLQRQWYVHCLRIIAFLGGFFCASLINTWAGQRGVWDITVSVLLLGFIEVVNWLVYNQNWITEKTSLNLFKVGLLFGLAVEAFKLAS